jgi:uncharacterized membrane protein YagU involved in acid resistance
MVLGQHQTTMGQSTVGQSEAGTVHVPLGRVALHGIIGGLIAGAVFAMAAMVMAALLEGRASGFWVPLRMIGAIVLGEEALMSSYSLLKAGAAGMVLHMMLSAMFGLGFALAVQMLPALRRPAVLIVAASGYGLLLWIANFQIIAPAAGWGWFPDMADQFWQGFVAHTFMFGTVLGVSLAAVRPWRESRGGP